MDSFDDAIRMLDGIVARYDRRIDELKTQRGRRRDVTRLTIERDAVQAAIDELNEGPDGGPEEDDHDVPVAVRELVEYLATGQAPPHPYAGSRDGRDEPGHCRVCTVVGHLVAHPERSCDEVGCVAEHDLPEIAVTLDEASGPYPSGLGDVRAEMDAATLSTGNGEVYLPPPASVSFVAYPPTGPIPE